MEIYLVRHTTPWIEKGICYGQSDIPLATTFDAEKNALLPHLPKLPDAVYSSPMTRCYQLARYLHAEQQVITDTRLLEMDFGDWEMKKWEDINEQEVDKWMKDFVTVSVPNGENFIALQQRVQEFSAELLKKKEEKIIIVTHAGVIRCFVAAIFEMALKDAFKIQVDYASITKIQFHEDSCLNKVEYLNYLA